MTYLKFTIFCVVLAVAQISAADSTPPVAPKCTFNGTQIVLSVDETLAFQKSNWSMVSQFHVLRIEKSLPDHHFIRDKLHRNWHPGGPQYHKLDINYQPLCQLHCASGVCPT